MRVQWYFDFVSPYSYLQWEHQLPRLKSVDVEYKPVLFAGLLKHWGQKGPAEISAKRRFTYRHIQWLARQFGVPLRLPTAHPFNPLSLLRACIARESRPDTIGRLFDFVWRDGHVPTETGPWQDLIDSLDLAEESLRTETVKQALITNGEEAIDQQVFGVPTLVADGEVFWGVDGFDFFLAYLDDPAIFDTPGMHATDTLPSGV